MADDPELKFTVTGDTSGLEAAVKRAKTQVGQLGGELRQGVNDFAKWSAAGVAAGTAMAVAITRDAAQAGKEIANLARLSGIGVEEFQKLAAASNTVGISQEKLSDVFKDVRDRVGDFIQTGGGPLADFFERIAPKVGVTAEQFRRLSGPEALQLFVNSMEEAGLSANELTFQMEAVASDATALLPLLKDGGAEMKNLGDQAAEAGRIMSEFEIGRLQLAAKEMAAFDRTVSTLKNQLGAELAPILAGVGKLFEDAATEAGGFDQLASQAVEQITKGMGFVADAVEGVKRTFEVAGNVIAQILLGVQDVVLTLAHTIINEPVNAVNMLIEAFNQLPGIDIEPVGLSSLGQGIMDQLTLVRGAAAEAESELQAILMRPFPSSSIEQWVAETTAGFDEAARSYQERLSAISGGEGLAVFGTEGADGESARGGGGSSNDQLKNRLDQIRQANMSEVQLLNEKFAMENEALNKAREQQLITEEEWFQLLKQQEERQQEELTEIEDKASEARKKIAEKEAQAKRAALGDALSSLTTLMNSESKKMFEIGKAAALAQAIVDGKAAVVGAYKVGASQGGPALGAAYAAAAGLATLQQINSIRSASFGGGGGGGTTGGSVTQGVNNQTQPVQSLNVNLQGFDPSQLYSGQQVGGLLDVLIDEAADRGLNLAVSR